jgi:hypothetical protein
LEEIKQYFETKYGTANLHQVYSDKLEYFLIFQQQEAGIKLKNFLENSGGEQNCNSINCFNGSHIKGRKG